MKRVLALALAAVVIGCTGYGLIGRGGAEPKAQPVVQSAAVGGLGYIEGARPEVPMRPQVTGVVAALRAQRSQPVKAGQLLAELDSDSQSAQVDLAEAELERMRVELEQADADLSRARRSGGGVSRQEADRCFFAHKLALARMEEAQARVRSARAELAKTQLRAPYDCVVLEVNVEPGQRVGPDSAEPMLVLADLSRRRVLVYVDEVDATRVAVGQPAAALVDGLPGRSFAGRVSEVKPRMGRRPIHSDAPDEYRDVWSRGVYVDLEGGQELPPNLRVRVKIQVP